MTVYYPIAPGGLKQRGKKTDGGAFARPVRPDKTEHLTRFDFQIQTVHRDQFAVMFAEVN
jgi:hypothetical protein